MENQLVILVGKTIGSTNGTKRAILITAQTVKDMEHSETIQKGLGMEKSLVQGVTVTSVFTVEETKWEVAGDITGTF